MRRGKKLVIAATLVLGSFAVVPIVQAATPPAVTAVIQGNERTTGANSLIVTGTKLNKFKTFSLVTNPGGVGAESPALLVKGKTQITLLLPGGLAPGGYTLSLQPKNGDPTTVDFPLQGPPLLENKDNIGVENGVWGSTDAADFAGVRGEVYGETGDGVLGLARNNSIDGAGVGVRGLSFGVKGIGVLANVTADGGPDSVALHCDHSGFQGDIARFQNQGLTVADIDLTGKGTFNGGVVGTSSFDGVSGTTNSDGWSGVFGRAANATGFSAGVWGQGDSDSGAGVFAVGSGNGAAGLWARQDAVTGPIALFEHSPTGVVARIDHTGKGFFNGGTQTGGADFAESVTVNRPKSEFEPGDVMVIDPAGERRFALSTVAESPLVAGIYSTKPGVLARRNEVVDQSKWADTEVPLAITGIVPCKVCDEGGPIRAGDLLVAASIPGHAKKAPANPPAGTLVGKALGRLDGARGKIEVLITMR